MQEAAATTVHNVSDRRFDWIGAWKVEPLVFEKLNASDVGRTVIYRDHHRAEAGTLSSFRDGRVWARYSKGDTAAGANAANLCFGVYPLDGDTKRALNEYDRISAEISQGNEMREEEEVARSPKGSLRGGPGPAQKGKEAQPESVMHTPGPWTAKRKGIHGVGNYTVIGHAGNWHSEIARVYHGDRFANGLADARLIAAAPDLLDALKAADDAMDMQEKREASEFHINGQTAWEIWSKARSDIAAALAKAGA